MSEPTDEPTYLPSSHTAPKQLGKPSTSGRIIDPASDPTEQYGMQTVVKAFDERKNERSASPSFKQCGMQTVVKAVDERTNKRFGEPAAAPGIVSKFIDKRMK